MKVKNALVGGWVLARRRKYFNSIKAQIINDFKERGLYYCWACGAVHGLELHHIKPLAMGGLSNIENISPLCKDCHTDAHNYINGNIKTLCEVST